MSILLRHAMPRSPLSSVGAATNIRNHCTVRPSHKRYEARYRLRVWGVAGKRIAAMRVGASARFRRRDSAFLFPHNPFTPRIDGSLRTIGELELAQDVADVPFDRLLA